MIVVDIVFINSLAVGGAEKILRTIADETARRGRLVKIVILAKRGLAEWVNVHTNIEIIHLDSIREKVGLLTLAPLVMRLSRGYEIDKVYSSGVHLNGVLCLLRRLRVLHCHSLVLRESTVIADRFRGARKWEFLMFYAMYRSVDLLICQTDYMKTRLLEFIPRFERFNVHVIPNPVDYGLACMRSEEKTTAICDENYIVTVGRLIETKGGDLLVQAFAKVLSEYPDLKLLFLGMGVEKSRWESVAQELGIMDKVVFGGHSANPFPQLKKSKMGVIASRCEGFPNVLLEMMCVCDRVVATKCAGGIAQLPGITTCETHSVDELVEAMLCSLGEKSSDNMKIMRGAMKLRGPGNFLDKINNYL